MDTSRDFPSELFHHAVFEDSQKETLFGCQISTELQIQAPALLQITPKTQSNTARSHHTPLQHKPNSFIKHREGLWTRARSDKGNGFPWRGAELDRILERNPLL